MRASRMLTNGSRAHATDSVSQLRFASVLSDTDRGATDTAYRCEVQTLVIDPADGIVQPPDRLARPIQCGHGRIRVTNDCFFDCILDASIAHGIHEAVAERMEDDLSSFDTQLFQKTIVEEFSENRRVGLVCPFVPVGKDPSVASDATLLDVL